MDLITCMRQEGIVKGTRIASHRSYLDARFITNLNTALRNFIPGKIALVEDIQQTIVDYLWEELELEGIQAFTNTPLGYRLKSTRDRVFKDISRMQIQKAIGVMPHTKKGVRFEPPEMYRTETRFLSLAYTDAKLFKPYFEATTRIEDDQRIYEPGATLAERVMRMEHHEL